MAKIRIQSQSIHVVSMAKQIFMLHSYIVHKICSKLNDVAHFDWKWTEKRAKLTHIWWLLAIIKEYRPKMTGPSLMLGNRYWPNVLCPITTCIRILGNHGHGYINIVQKLSMSFILWTEFCEIAQKFSFRRKWNQSLIFGYRNRDLLLSN